MRIQFSQFLLYVFIILLPLQSIAQPASDTYAALSAVSTIPITEQDDANPHCAGDDAPCPCSIDGTNVCNIGCNSCPPGAAADFAFLPLYGQPVAAASSSTIDLRSPSHYVSRIPAPIPRPPDFSADFSAATSS